MITVLLLLLGTVSTQLLKFTNLDYRTVQQLTGLRNLVKLQEGVVATCNLVLFTQPADFRSAEESCESFDIGMGSQEGQLVSIKNSDRSWALQLFMDMGLPLDEQPENVWASTRWAWTGLRKTENNVGKIKKNNRYSVEDWQWADGIAPGNFSNWRRKQPDQKKEKTGKNGCEDEPACYQNYMRIDHKGEWDDAFHYTQHPYICEYRGRFLVSAEKKTWHDAKEECRQAGLELAKIRSDQDLEELKNAADYYLGPYTDKTESSWIWVNGQRRNKTETEQVEWEYSDCETITWNIRWEDGSQSEAEKKEVLTMSRWGTIDGEWKDGESRPFACQCPDS